jgi:hypothetical protein
LNINLQVVNCSYNRIMKVKLFRGFYP